MRNEQIRSLAKAAADLVALDAHRDPALRELQRDLARALDRWRAAKREPYEPDHDGFRTLAGASFLTPGRVPVADVEGVEIAGVPAPFVSRLLRPSNYTRADDLARTLAGGGPGVGLAGPLLRWVEDAEEYERTAEGDAMLAGLRERSSITLSRDDGGPRWFLDGRAIHCGDGIEALSGGRWVRLRWEIAWHAPDAARWEAGGRAPRLFMDASGSQLAISPRPGDLTNGVFRWPA